MPVLRALLAIGVAVSLIMAPFAAGAAGASEPAGMSMQDRQDMPCCPASDWHKNENSALCAFKCIAAMTAILSAATATPAMPPHNVSYSFVSDSLQGRVVGPPTHPPPA